MGKQNIKKGDMVIMRTGNDRGKTGKVLAVFPQEQHVLVEGINKVQRHERKRRDTGKGQIIEKSLPVHISNVGIAEPKTGKAVRTRRRFDEKKKQFVRVVAKSGIEI